jgi:NAD(P)-dependent dehydrogenase (short-subunit alcohol dehydrogenase family)/uncharacterized OB-fold protein
MSDRLPPERKNPVLKTREPTVPPSLRSRAAMRLTAAACDGCFELQQCRSCGRFQYPPREACFNCLSTMLEWTPCDGSGELISQTTLHHSNENYFRERLPLRIGLVRLDIGVDVLAYIHENCSGPPARVTVRAHLDRSGQAALAAYPTDRQTGANEDRLLRDMTCDPKFRKVLVTDGKTAAGQAIVKALLAAGADLVWVGVAEPWKRSAGLDAIASLPEVTVVPLDITDSRSVVELAGLIGGKVDILVNTAEIHRNRRIGARGLETARAEMEVNYFGLLRLIEAFGPDLKARAADGEHGAAAWVNLLSIHALSALPTQSSFTASKAAAFALSQSLRADLQPAGLRVINVFPGPIDDEWNQLVPQPKLTPAALADAVVAGLRDGTEDIYPGDVARDLLTRWRLSAKVLERELAGQ